MRPGRLKIDAQCFLYYVFIFIPFTLALLISLLPFKTLNRVTTDYGKIKKSQSKFCTTNEL